MVYKICTSDENMIIMMMMIIVCFRAHGIMYLPQDTRFADTNPTKISQISQDIKNLQP